MSPKEKEVFKLQAEQLKGTVLGSNKKVEKYTTHGIPYSQIEKEQQMLEQFEINMKFEINQMIKRAILDNSNK